jgi:hypothetical protein
LVIVAHSLPFSCIFFFYGLFFCLTPNRDHGCMYVLY